jgi:MarR family transcriptional regulator, organic hydroperoxide resistance regulator
MREGGKLLSQAQQLSSRAFAKILKKHGVSELSPGQGRIVYELWKADELSQSELAARTKLDKSTMALMLERLEATGQVKRVPDPEDARRRLVRATDANRAMNRAYEAASKEITELFYRGMKKPEIDAFEETLRKIISNLEEDTL